MATCFEPHNHRCKCGVVWHHDPSALLDSDAHDKAHQCPECGTDQGWIDDSGEVPRFCHNGIRTVKLTGAKGKAINKAMGRKGRKKNGLGWLLAPVGRTVGRNMQLEKRKSKLTFETASTVYERGRRAIVIQAEPDFARIRLKGLRHSIDVSWEGIYHFAARVHADRLRREKNAEKERSGVTRKTRRAR